MTDKQEISAHGALVQAGLADRAQAISEGADARSARIAARDERTGRVLAKVSDEEWDWAIERIEAGDLEANIARHLGVSRSAIHLKRARDEDFEERYQKAVLNCYLNLAHDIRAITRGVEGYSTGDVRRDELVAKYDLELAKRFAGRIIGDRIQHDVRAININIDRDNGDW